MPIFLADFTKQNNMTENEMTGLLLKLADLGVTGIKIFYSGGGDSGDIDDIVYTTTKEASFDDIMNLDNCKTCIEPNLIFSYSFSAF